MPRLILMRHAKSCWSDPEPADRERPLAARGRLAAVLMGAWLEEAGLIPDFAAISSARRCVESFARLGRGAGRPDLPSERRDALYMAEPAALLSALRAGPAEAETLLIMGHEPGLTAFLRRLHDGAPAPGTQRVFEKFPTAGAALLELPAGPWAEAAFGRARLAGFTVPKDLV